MADRNEVAKLAGVSTATVTRVTSGKGYVKQETREKVIRVIENLDYKPNVLAQNLRMKKSNIIAVLVEDLCNAYTAESVEIMTKEARLYGYFVMLFTVTDRKIDQVIDEAIQNRVAGVINLTLVEVTESNRKKLAEAKIRTVNISYPSELDIRPEYEQAMREAYQRMFASGKNKPIYMGGIALGWLLNDNRIQTFLKLNREYGLPCGEEAIVAGSYPLEKYQDIGYREMSKLLEEGRDFDTVFCMTDSLAMGTMHAIMEHGRRIPQDIAIVGCDNVKISSMLTPALTTIDNGCEMVSKEYIRYILSDDSNMSIDFNAKLVVRETL